MNLRVEDLSGYDDDLSDFVSDPKSIKTFRESCEVLGVNEDASNKEIKDQFRNLAKKYHPDKVKDKEELFKKVEEAQKFLLSKVVSKYRKTISRKTVVVDSPNKANHEIIDEEVTLHDDDFVITDIGYDKINSPVAERDEFIQICQKDEWSKEDFVRLKELNEFGAMPYEHPDLSRFAYYAIDKAIESGDQQSIKNALLLTDIILTQGSNEYYRPDEVMPLSINKFRSNVDDLLYAYFSDPENNFNPDKYINSKLYPQADVKVQAFKLLEYEANKQGSSVESHKEASSAIEGYKSTPNKGQLNRIIGDLEFLAPTREAARIIKEMTPEKQNIDQNLLAGNKKSKKIQDDKLYKTDLSKYPGKSNAEIAMEFSDYYQWTSLAMGLSPKEATQQTPENIILSLHRHKEETDPGYREIPDTIQETIANIPNRMRDAITGVFAPKTEKIIPQAIGERTFSKDILLYGSKDNLINGGDNKAVSVSGKNESINNPKNKVSTTSQLALGAVAVGAMAMGVKKAYNFYTQNFGEDATPESIKEAKSLLLKIVRSDQDFTKIYDGLTSRYNNLAGELNSLYDKKQQNTPLYKRTRDELDYLLQKKEEAYDLENRVMKIKEDYKNLDKPNLKAKYIEGIIKEYNSLTKGYDKLILEESIYEMKQKEPAKKKTTPPPKSSRSHAERILDERHENKQRSSDRSQE